MKIMHLVPRLWPKHQKICKFSLVPWFWHILVDILRHRAYFSYWFLGWNHDFKRVALNSMPIINRKMQCKRRKIGPIILGWENPKNCRKITIFDFVQFSTFFEHFLSPGWLDQFLSFAMRQVSQDTSLEYPQRVLWKILFLTFRGVCTIFRAISDTFPGLGFEFRVLRLFAQTQSHTFGT